MSRRVKLLLVIIGALIVVCALIALAYAYFPAEDMLQKFPLSPTLFSPP